MFNVSASSCSAAHVHEDTPTHRTGHTHKITPTLFLMFLASSFSAIVKGTPQQSDMAQNSLVVQKELKIWLKTLAPTEIFQTVLAYMFDSAQLNFQRDFLRAWRLSIDLDKIGEALEIVEGLEIVDLPLLRSSSGSVSSNLESDDVSDTDAEFHQMVSRMSSI